MVGQALAPPRVEEMNPTLSWQEELMQASGAALCAPGPGLTSGSLDLLYALTAP
jgi:hypothetical protein